MRTLWGQRLVLKHSTQNMHDMHAQYVLNGFSCLCCIYLKCCHEYLVSPPPKIDQISDLIWHKQIFADLSEQLVSQECQVCGLITLAAIAKLESHYFLPKSFLKQMI